MRWRLQFPCLLAVLAITCRAPLFADDQQKAEKQLRKISAMAADVNARAIVSRTVADMVNVKRDQLVRERRAMNLSYGDVFLAHQLTAKGAKMLDIALEIPVRNGIYNVANHRHVDWKQIASEAKKLNGRIEDSIYKHFLHPQTDSDRDAADKYDAKLDWVKADVEMTPAELLEAQETYVLWRTRAGQIGGKGDNVSASDELVSRKIQEHSHDVRLPPPTTH